ncbi:MAG: D-alanine--D-alanine ligase [Bacteroidia bacterium]|jgi:D-alanine-D-alanine ligase|nr:D-alanine--D-alanine ligase [Bacteroidia bacterium]
MIKVGIFFGGNSREREVSFAGGRTVYDNLDKTVFEAVPIFVDSFNNFILLDWEYIYKGSIRDFYPPVQYLKKAKYPIQVYAESIEDAYADRGRKMAAAIGKIIAADALKTYMDIAFLALHGTNGEDGTIQGILEWQQIPYTGSGILPSAIGMHKQIQKSLLQQSGFNSPKWASITKSEWLTQRHNTTLAQKLTKAVGLPFVVKPANQGSSVGVSVITKTTLADLPKAIDKSFFIQEITQAEWKNVNGAAKIAWIQKICDVKEGIGLPLILNEKTIYHPDDLIATLDRILAKQKQVLLEGLNSETSCLIESFIDGREFSCIVLQDEHGKPIALPPTEIVKGKEVYDYRSKYLPGLSRKVTPIDLPEKDIQRIRKECVALFSYFHFNVYARIDGFITANGTIYLNDPNTTSGMMPSSFFFHQAAEIGLNPSQFLTYIIRASLSARVNTLPVHHSTASLLVRLDEELLKNKKAKKSKKKVAVMMGGYSTERHISVESGRNIYEKLASSTKYEPFPVFVTGNDEEHELYLIPINVMLKDNADDIRDKAKHFKRAAIIDKIISECQSIVQQFGNEANLFAPRKITYNELAKRADAVFIALHGRPGEDGTVQKELIKRGIPFNGSGVESSQITINKFTTNQLLKKHGFEVADQFWIAQDDWTANQHKLIESIEKVGYPLIAKPADDGCSSAVKKIQNRQALIDYATGVFRKSALIPPSMASKLGLKPKEEFPKKQYFLVEKFVDKQQAVHFLEVTGGLLTHYNEKGDLVYESFEPSETLAEGDILSLEEKFLAGQGQNITPARYHQLPKIRSAISKQVQRTLVAGAKVLKVEGYCRIDAFVRINKLDKPEVIFIEVNSLPGMTPATAIFHQCALNGYKPYEFIDAILTFGEQRTRKSGKK